MISSANMLVYSASAARRIFQVPAGLRVRVVKYWRVCWVWVQGERPRFVSLTVFKTHFVSWRMQASAPLSVSKTSSFNWRTVANPGSGKRYPVAIAASGPICRCDDYRNQMHLLGRGVCKHGYAVLRSLGYGSLSSYLSRKKS
jgi:hypothetical protein